MPVMSVDFYTKIKFGGHLAIRAFWPLGRIWRDFFYYDVAESLDWRWFRETDFAKSCFQRT
jgi:predicted DCC family thiol-disulfide oxidoreductase YuxK